MDFQDFVGRLQNVHGKAARCPAHADTVNSLSFDEGQGGSILVYCHAGCPLDRIVVSLGLTIGDLQGTPHITAEYPYYSETGELMFTVERWVPKTFRVRPGMPEPALRPLYNMVAILWARANGAVIYVVEGERDVDLLAAQHVPATCNAGGAGKWLDHHTATLAGMHVVVVADDDLPGRTHARDVASRLRGVAASVELMKSRVGNDLGDALDAGYDISVLEPLPDFEDVPSYLARNVPTRKVSWAWDGYFPLGKISLIEGDPGGGKSILTTDLAARWSTGMKMPDGSNGFGPCPVVLVSAEDDADDTVCPRLEAAGADLSVVHLVLHGTKPTDPFTFANLDAIYRLIARTGARVVFFDPLMAFIDGNIDSHNDASVRRALQPLKIMASTTGAAVVLIRHLNKGGSGTKAIYRGGGSIGFTGAARAVFLVTESAADPSLKVLSNVKSNLARKPPSLGYAVEISAQEMPYVAWKGPVDVTAQEALDGPGRGPSEASDERRSKKRVRNQAGEFLLDVLDKPMPWKEIVELGKAEGFSAMTLERARAEVGLSRITGEGGNATTTWARPEVAPTPPLPHFVSSHGHSTKPPRNEEVTKREPKPESSSDLDEDEKLDQALAEAELECDVCHTTINVNRYGKPYRVIRCIAHDPRYYGGGNDEEKAGGNHLSGGVE